MDIGRGLAIVIAFGVGCAVGDPDAGDGLMLGGSTTAGPVPPTGGTVATSSEGGGPSGSGMQGTTASSADATGGADSGATTNDGCKVPAPWYPDDDEDGFGDPAGEVLACDPPAGHVSDDTDCDDDDEDVFPGAQETCGGPDTNCDFAAPPLCNSCLQQLASGNTTGDGLYTIDPDGEGDPVPPTQVWCDMTTDGGGWTMVQRTVWDPAQTNALRTGYANWYTLTLGNPSPGQAFRLQGSAWEHLNIQLDHMLRHDLRRQSDGGSCPPLFYMGIGGTLTVTDSATGLTGLSSDVTMINDTNLSTLDSGPSATCVVSGTAVPWFYGSCCSTCPTYQGGYWTEPHPMVSYVSAVPDAFGNIEVDVCTSPAQLAMTGTFVGLNAMEYYLR